jgi:hypothetical protein
MQETGLTSLHKLLIINMPYFLYQDLIIMHTHMFIRTRRFNIINQASVLLYFSLIFMILSRIELILPIQLEEERSIYLIQSSFSLSTCAADRLLTKKRDIVAIAIIGLRANRPSNITIYSFAYTVFGSRSRRFINLPIIF